MEEEHEGGEFGGGHPAVGVAGSVEVGGDAWGEGGDVVEEVELGCEDGGGPEGEGEEGGFQDASFHAWMFPRFLTGRGSSSWKWVRSWSGRFWK